MPPPPRTRISIQAPQDGAVVRTGQPLTASGTAVGRGVTVWVGNDAPITATYDRSTRQWQVVVTPTSLGSTTLSARSKSYLNPLFGKTQTIGLSVVP